MRHDPHMRCICLIANLPEIKDFIITTAQSTNSDVVYVDEVAELDDLDYVDRVTAYDQRYYPDEYRYRYGSLWARREQYLEVFWGQLSNLVGDNDHIIPIIFADDTITIDW